MTQTYVTKEGRLCGPETVGKKARAMLVKVYEDGGWVVAKAPVVIERLRRGGYVTVREGMAYITEAGCSAMLAARQKP